MTRDKALVAAVQTAAVVRALRPRSGETYFDLHNVAAGAVVIAAALPEEAVPHDVAAAAIAIVEWRFDPWGAEPDFIRDWKAARAGVP